LKLIQRFKDAFTAFREGINPVYQVDLDDNQWTRVTGDSSRDLAPYNHELAQKIAYYLFERNPLAKRLIEMTAEYIISEGVKVKAEDQELQQFLDDFWKINDLENRLWEYTKELGLWGEQCYQAFVNQVNGRTRLGYHTPGRIKGVVLDPENVLQIQRIVLNNDKTLAPVVPLELGQDGSFFAGDTFFFKINSVISSSRGRSDLFAGADYLDMSSQFVFSRGERSIFGNAWFWDVLVEGATKEDCEKFAKTLKLPNPGSARVHNEKMKWTAVTPDFKAHDASYDAKLLKNFCLGSMGFPGHFFGDSGDTNRATALEMHEPVVKRLTTRQRFTCGIWTKIHDFAIDKGIAFKSLKPDINRNYQFYYPEISASDMQRSGLTMLYLAQSLAMAVKAGWISGESAAKVYAGVASSFGPNVEPQKKVKPQPDPVGQQKIKREQQNAGN
jgi:hypothetical protein